jgi:hypothetical protein
MMARRQGTVQQEREGVFVKIQDLHLNIGGVWKVEAPQCSMSEWIRDVLIKMREILDLTLGAGGGRNVLPPASVRGYPARRSIPCTYSVCREWITGGITKLDTEVKWGILDVRTGTILRAR